MRNILTIAVILSFFLAGHSTCLYAQTPDENVKITIEKNGRQLKTYIFPKADKGVVYSAMQQQDANEKYVDINCVYSFPPANGNDDVQLMMRVEPAGTGTFTIPLPDKDIPQKRSALSIQFTPGSGGKEAKTFRLGGESEEDVSGTITVDHYGQPGDYISGHFDANIKDMGENHSGFYHVTGSFKIQRSE
jgi:hypothetical protein